MEPDLGRNCPHGHAALAQFMDQSVALLVRLPRGFTLRLRPCDDPWQETGRRHITRSDGPWWCWRERLLNVCAVLLQHLFERIAEILEHMPAVGHVDGLRRTERGPFRVCFGSITADDFDPRMGAQPGGDSGCRAIRQQVDDLLAL
jgi:hypothetical protein